MYPLSFSSLPPRFPLVGPVVTVFPPVEHTWVNEQVRTPSMCIKQLPYLVYMSYGTC